MAKVLKKALSPYEVWMVKSNLKYIEAEGIEVVVSRLRAGGYVKVADAVQEQYDAPKVRTERQEA